MEHGYVLHLKDWEVNNPVQLKEVLEVFDHIQAEFNKAQSDDKKVSILDCSRWLRSY
jgi:catalase (peroxidase I)